MELSIIAVLFLVFILLLSWLIYGPSKYSFPPGPRGLPLLGNFLQMRNDPHLQLYRWAEEYGKIFSIHLGRRPTIVVNDAKVVKELLSHPVTTPRFKTYTILLISRGLYGVANTDGEEWAEQRSFCSQNLAKYSFGRMSPLESMYVSAVQEVIDWAICETQKCQAVSPTKILMNLAANTLMSTLTGEKMTVFHSKLADFLEDYLPKLQKTQQTGLGFLPLLRYIAPVASGFKAFDEVSAKFHEMIRGLLDERRKTHLPGAPTDFVDTYVEKLMSTTDPKSTFYGPIGELNAVASIVELFLAGAETTGQTTSWLILYVSHHPEVQHKLQSEVDNVIGKSRDPSLLDKSSMPYTEAVILETLRMSSLVPLGLIHELADDHTFQGYSLPKGALLISNLYYVHYNPDVWGDPNVFRPERFLDANGTTVINRELIHPFQAGRRACLGESLAMNLIFLFTVKFFQSLEVFPDPSEQEANFRAEFGLVLRVPSYKVAVKPRN